MPTTSDHILKTFAHWIAFLLFFPIVAIATPNPGYDYQIVASTGSDGLISIKPDVSINALGNVALVGEDSVGNSIWYWAPDAPGPRSINENFRGPSRDFAFPQISDGGSAGVELIAARERSSVGGGAYLIRAWKTDGSFETIAYPTDGRPVTLPSINNHGAVAYLETSIAVGNHTLVKRDSTMLASFEGNLAARPMLSDRGSVVLRTGNEASAPIRVYGSGPGDTETVASAPAFRVLGRSPGISDDGDVVAFAGDRGNGPGIFVRYKKKSGAIHLVRIAGENQRLEGQIVPEFGLHRDAVDSNGLPIPIYFEAFDLDGRVGVIRQSMPKPTPDNHDISGDTIIACFLAKPNHGNSSEGLPDPANPFTAEFGLWTVRLDIDNDGTATAGSHTPVCVAQIGDSFDGKPPITQIVVHDPISLSKEIKAGAPATASRGRHRLAFWASTGSDSYVVKAGSKRSIISMHAPPPQAITSQLSDSIDAPLVIDGSELDALRSAREVQMGLVADGVTPLLVRIDTSSVDPPPTEIRIEIEKIDAILPDVARRLDGLVDGTFSGGKFAKVLSNGESFARLSPFKIEDLKDPVFDSSSTIKCRLRVYHAETQAEIAQRELEIIAPPVALVHGYNADETSWASDFTASFETAKRRVYKINYGIDTFVESNGKTTVSKDTNTYGSLHALANVLDGALREQVENRLALDYAFTRYDAVGHSQGGVLLRMLCATSPGLSLEDFRSDSNFHRGRFRRIITIGSPHNGTRLVRYLRSLTQTADSFVITIGDLLLNQMGGTSKANESLRAFWSSLITGFVWDQGIVQPKFDPWDDQIRELNGNDSIWQADPAARFLFIATRVNDGKTPAQIAAPAILNGGLSWFVLNLTTQGRGNVVLPSGSDGIVDYRSQCAGLSGGNGVVSVNNENICHIGGPEAALGWGATSGQPSSSSTGRIALDALNGDSRYRFIAFPNISLLSNTEKQSIDRLGFGTLHVENMIQTTTGTRRSRDAYIEKAFTLEAPSTRQVAGPVAWSVFVVGGNASVPAPEIIYQNEQRTSIVVRYTDALVGDVVLNAMYATSDGTRVAAFPVLVDSRSNDARITGIRLVPREHVWEIGDSISPRIYALWSDGGAREVYTGILDIAYKSSDPEVVDVNAGLAWTVRGSGSATITATYLGFSAHAHLTVAGPPRVVLPPSSQIIAVGSATTLRVHAGGVGPFEYQWFHDGQAIPDATRSTLVLHGIQPANAGDYSVTISNAYGSATSLAATLVVLPNTNADALRWPLTDGVVSAIASHAGTTYIGGRFSKIGEDTGGGVAFSRTTGKLLEHWPYVNGPVLAAIADNAGGFYIAGSFNTVGGLPRSRLARIRADGSVDTSFAPSVAETYTIHDSGNALNLPAVLKALFLHGKSLYIGGQFTSIGSIERWSAAALDADSGGVLPWNPSIEAMDPGTSSAIPGLVNCLLVDEDGVYVGGTFTFVNRLTSESSERTARRFIARFDNLTGAVAEWNPNAIYALLPARDQGDLLVPKSLSLRGTDLFVAGGASSSSGANIIGDQRRASGIAKIDIATGTVLPWNPVIRRASDGYYSVGSIVVSGNRVFGAIDAINMNSIDIRTTRLFSVNAVNGVVDSWNPRVGVGFVNANDDESSIRGLLQCLALNEGVLYALGSFDRVNTAKQSDVVGLDPITGDNIGFRLDRSFSRNFDRFQAMKTIAISGDILFVGGDFRVFSVQSRRNLAAVWTDSGTILPWNPNVERLGEQVSTRVKALAAVDGAVFVGGNFTHGNVTEATFNSIQGGLKRNNLAAFDPINGGLIDWDPNVNAPVHALLELDGLVYAGGEFSQANGNISRNFVAAFDSFSGLASPWNPDADNFVRALATDGTHIFAGGHFHMVNGDIPRRGIASFDLDGSATNFDPNIAVNSVKAVRTLGIMNGRLYAGGDFAGPNSVNKSVERNFAASFNLDNAQATAWDPNPNAPVHTMAVRGSVVFLGGSFSLVNGGSQSRDKVAAFNVLRGDTRPFELNPGFQAFRKGNIEVLHVVNERVLAGGEWGRQWTNYGNVPEEWDWETFGHPLADAPGFMAYSPPISFGVSIDEWRQQFFQSAVNSGPGADLNDPDQDGQNNLLEYALGGNPINAASSRSVTASVVQNQGRQFIAVVVPKNPTAIDIDYVVEVSTDLIDWVQGAGETRLVREDDFMLIVRDVIPLGIGPERFMRLRVVHMK